MASFPLFSKRKQNKKNLKSKSPKQRLPRRLRKKPKLTLLTVFKKYLDWSKK
jgi:hypothetical protein